MDLFSMDKKLADFSNQNFGQFLDDDLFTPSPSNDSNSMDFSLDNGMDQDWLDTFFDDPVLNDRMISDALQPHPQVQSEHSYSLANEKAVDMTIKKEQEKDSDSELLGAAVNPNNMTLTIKTEDSSQSADNNTSTSQCNYILASPASSCSSLASPRSVLTTNNTTTNQLTTNTAFIKKEPMDTETTTMITVTRTVNPQTLLKPTIILATQPAMHTTTTSHSSHHQERLVLPKVSVQVDAAQSISGSSSMCSPDHISYDQLSLPPTPPSSNSSDSEGCQSPDHSQPSSPVRGGGSHHHHHHTLMSHTSHHSSRPVSPSPFFMNPIPTSGVLLLSEEEKRTLISEGYPIPAKLPLTKGEEKNLKKIRRKIKNKISAQESRRKKKEYLESLERKVESYSQENVDLKKKCDSLENNNRSLMSQLQKLQSIVGKLRPQNTTQTSTCLMVLVLCFAVFLGTWSPMSWSIGYSSSNATPGNLGGLSDHHHFGAAPSYEELVSKYEDGLGMSQGGGGGGGQMGGAETQYYSVSKIVGVMGPEVKEATTDPYSTGNLKSRVLLSVREEEEQRGHSYYNNQPQSFCLKDYISQWFLTAHPEPGQAKQQPEVEEQQASATTTSLDQPPIPKVDVLDVEFENNQTGEGRTIQGTAASDNRRPEDQASMHPDITVMAQTRKQLDTAA